MRGVTVLALALVLFSVGCSEKPESQQSSPNNTARETAEVSLSLQEANQKLRDLIPFKGAINVNGTKAVITIENKLPAHTVTTSGIAEAVYKASKIFCQTNTNATKVALAVYYTIGDEKDLLFRVKTYKPILCNAVTAADKTQEYSASKGIIVLNNLRTGEIEIGNKQWFKEFCANDRVSLFCSKVSF